MALFNEASDPRTLCFSKIGPVLEVFFKTFFLEILKLSNTKSNEESSLCGGVGADLVSRLPQFLRSYFSNFKAEVSPSKKIYFYLLQ